MPLLDSVAFRDASPPTTPTEIWTCLYQVRVLLGLIGPQLGTPAERATITFLGEEVGRALQGLDGWRAQTETLLYAGLMTLGLIPQGMTML